MSAIERSLVILKPKAVSGGHMGEIISRFERIGLKMIAGNLLHAHLDVVSQHYPNTRVEFIEGMGKKSIENYEKFGLNIHDDFGTSDPHSIGLTIREWLIEMLTSDLVFVCVWEGPHAIEIIRKVVGHTLPVFAAPGTIRGDFSYDSSYLANLERRPVDNLIHASGNKEEASYEIGLWFPHLQ